MFHSYNAYFNVLMYVEISCFFSLYACCVLCFIIRFVYSMFPSTIFHVHVLTTLLCTNDRFMGFFLFFASCMGDPLSIISIIKSFEGIVLKLWIQIMVVKFLIAYNEST